MWEYPAALIAGYVIGSVPFGYAIAAAHGVKIDKVGSGSSGSTNVMRALGRKWGMLVLALDMLKGFVAVALSVLVFDHSWIFSSAVLFVAALGHAYPVFLGFRGGGKSVNTIAGGMMLIASWQVLLAVLIIWLFFFATDKIQKRFIMSRNNLAIFGSSIPIGLGVSYQSPWWFLIGLGFSLFLCWTHRENIKRLLRGEEKPLKVKR